MVTSLSSPKSPNSIKLLCSYGGKILPRRPDGKLRYIGGQTRVLAVEQSISFQELLIKLGELHGSSVTLRCQLPEEDLDALVTITSDEDLANLIEEYDLASQAVGSQLKIRAFLWPSKAIKKVQSHSPTTTSPVKDFDSRKYVFRGAPMKSQLCYYSGFSQANVRYSMVHHQSCRRTNTAKIC